MFHVNLQEDVDESNVQVVEVPPKNRASGFHEEEDLTPLCKGRRIVYVKFMMNTPSEVWCK